MNEPGAPTLDQLNVLLAVVETGGFASAARRLNRANSVISYAIANLEAQLGLVLFDRDAAKRPVLTEAGKVVVAQARVIAGDVASLRAKAKGLLQGLEAEVNLVLDVMLPTERVVDALRAFRETFPTVTLRLHVEGLGAVTQMVLDRAATLGVAGPLEVVHGGDELDYIAVGSTVLIPVAAPDHPLAQGANPPGAGRGHTQLVLTDRSRLTEGRDFAVASAHTWRLADLGAKHLLLKEGFGWGNMPEPMVRDDLAAGRLKRLDMPDLKEAIYPLHAVYRNDTPPGPATAFLIARFKGQAV
ncbi:DNA-binding transcriptional LysR family regulator [Caulobacter sp. BE264]|uniref:LysR family transcriptional regulator n=1 Tax=Caulobacter sp. BE264 TaxID=2817724 RepID=UPI00285EA64B|nr:LysR family transcriptional regulator [Caulobacter sp. BE264]MDR7232197.1 DNA-binding transcriptional LysR family regulator [Caulobacter sp. BE264]